MVQAYKRKQLTPAELGNRRLLDYKKQAAKKMSENDKKEPLEVDEKGIYCSLKYDKQSGHLTDPYKIKKFEELRKKFEK